MKVIIIITIIVTTILMLTITIISVTNNPQNFRLRVFEVTHVHWIREYELSGTHFSHGGVSKGVSDKYLRSDYLHEETESSTLSRYLIPGNRHGLIKKYRANFEFHATKYPIEKHFICWRWFTCPYNCLNCSHFSLLSTVKKEVVLWYSLYGDFWRIFIKKNSS